MVPGIAIDVTGLCNGIFPASGSDRFEVVARTSDPEFGNVLFFGTKGIVGTSTSTSRPNSVIELLYAER